MKISNTTALLSESCDDEHLISGSEAVRRLSEHGYEVLDFNFAFFDHGDYILRGDDWQEKVDEVANTAAKCGVTFSQSHIPFCKIVPQLDERLRTQEMLDYFNECVRRAYIASGMLNVRYATVHPLTDIKNYSRSESLRMNHEYYDSYVELGMKYNVGTAFENMFLPFNRIITSRYGQHYDELIELVDSFHDKKVGICWDFGHANEQKLNQQVALRAIGHRLKNLHINDNSGTRDEHLLPFLGTINWNDIIPVLAEIDYDGDLTFETGMMTRHAARELQDAYIDATVACSKYLLKIYHNALEQIKGRV